MSIPRHEALLALGLVFLVGCAAVVARLFASRRHGVSIRMQVFLVVGVVTTILAALFTVVFLDRFAARAAVLARQAAEEDARIVAQLAEQAMSTFGLTLAEGTKGLHLTRGLYGFEDALGGTRVQFIGADGAILFDTLTSETTGDDLRARPEVVTALRGAIDPVARVAGEDRIATAAPVRQRGASGGPASVVGAVRVEKTTVRMAEVIAEAAPRVALLGLVLALVAAGAGWLVGRSLGRPIERLTHAAERIAAGERQAALPRPRGREVRALTAAFAEMRRELEQRDAVEALAADISHELKNPVASILASAEVLEEALDDDPAAARRFARRIRESAGRLDALVGDLLALARLEAQPEPARVAPVDLAAVVREAVAALPEGGAAVVTRLPAEAPLPGDPAWLRRAVGNLLANARQHAPAESDIRIELERTSDGWCLAVEDDGPGVASGVRERLFERFVTTRHGDGGTGLGLAIVRAVAERHGGTVRLATPEGEAGARFELSLRG